MRKILFSLLSITVLALTSCLETTQEITINEDGSGTLTNTNDMSALISVARNMGGGADMEKAKDKVIDSTIALKDGADDIPNVTAAEREMVKSGVLSIKMNMQKDQFLTIMSFPFTSPSQIPTLNQLSTKVLAETMKEKAGEGGAPTDQMPATSSIDDYYKFEFSNGELSRKVDKSKYEGVDVDEYLKGVKEAAGMGLVMKSNYVIHLPRPASKAEGKNVVLSDDKKTVTIKATIDDFFEDASSLEFKIKY